jgi:hypothetical protein
MSQGRDKTYASREKKNKEMNKEMNQCSANQERRKLNHQ